MLRLRLKIFLLQHGITERMLADAIAELDLSTARPVTVRYLRYITNNDEPLTKKNQARKPSLVMLSIIHTGLERLLDKPVAVGEVLEVIGRKNSPSPESE